VRLNRKGREPIKAIEDWLDHALMLRFIGRHEDWNVCLRPDKHAAKILPEDERKEMRRWFDRLEITRAVDNARAAGYPKSIERPTKTGTPTAFEVACETLKAENGPRMPSGLILTPDAVRVEYQRARRRRK
jgi:CHAD domain-containing protein